MSTYSIVFLDIDGTLLNSRHQIMSDAVVANKFNAYSQAMIMVESAIEKASGNQLGQSGMRIAESEINLFLNKS